MNVDKPDILSETDVAAAAATVEKGLKERALRRRARVLGQRSDRFEKIGVSPDEVDASSDKDEQNSVVGRPKVSEKIGSKKSVNPLDGSSSYTSEWVKSLSASQTLSSDSDHHEVRSSTTQHRRLDPTTMNEVPGPNFVETLLGNIKGDNVSSSTATADGLAGLFAKFEHNFLSAPASTATACRRTAGILLMGFLSILFVHITGVRAVVTLIDTDKLESGGVPKLLIYKQLQPLNGAVFATLQLMLKIIEAPSLTYLCHPMSLFDLSIVLPAFTLARLIASVRVLIITSLVMLATTQRAFLTKLAQSPKDTAIEIILLAVLQYKRFIEAIGAAQQYFSEYAVFSFGNALGVLCATLFYRCLALLRVF